MTTTSHTNALNWFEIPVRDIDRAQSFYEALLAIPMRRESMGPKTTLAVFSYAEPGVGGCLMAGETAPTPVDGGTLVYLNAGASLDVAVDRVDALGGRIVTPKVTLPDGMGCFVHITDLDGNRVGLHALA